MENRSLPVYEPPVVVTYTDEDILEALGPAQAVNPYAMPDDGGVFEDVFPDPT